MRPASGAAVCGPKIGNGRRSSFSGCNATGNSALLAPPKDSCARQSDLRMGQQIVDMPVKLSGFLLRQALVT
jgi:hypothetical protein